MCKDKYYLWNWIEIFNKKFHISHLNYTIQTLCVSIYYWTNLRSIIVLLAFCIFYIKQHHPSLKHQQNQLIVTSTCRWSMILLIVRIKDNSKIRTLGMWFIDEHVFLIYFSSSWQGFVAKYWAIEFMFLQFRSQFCWSRYCNRFCCLLSATVFLAF